MANKSSKSRAKASKTFVVTFQSAALKKKLKENISNENDLYLRLHRSISWLKAAEETRKPDYRFISLWISFNSLYASDLIDLQQTRCSEATNIYRFFKRMYECDREGNIDKMLWKRFSQEIRILLENEYVFHAFWERIAGRRDDWQREFRNSKERCKRHLVNANTVKLLAEIFSRLYVLRNQVIHGYAKYESIVNRDQMRDSAAILENLLPVFIKIMIEHPQVDLGLVKYPVVNHPYFTKVKSTA